MPYRDEQGHFISEAEARRRGLIPQGQEVIQHVDAPVEVGEDEDEEEEFSDEQGRFGRGQRTVDTVMVDTGRNNVVPIPVGSPFTETIERLADQANYGGYFRVFRNGSEILDPADAPEVFQAGDRIAITSYDKVG